MLIPAALSSFLPLSLLTPRLGDSSQSYNATCKHIARSISYASDVYYPGSLNFINGTQHWVPSSSQVSACSVEPGTVQDVSAIIRSGGHATTLGFSSTLGVIINLIRLNSLTYDPVSSTATLGTGLTWDQVYQKLEPYEVNVVGGRTIGIGIGGLVLGGGYSWLSNRHGLSIDTVTGFELVLPNGTVVDVTASSAPDLFFGLKGGYNNFGLVTKITMRTYKQGLVWGGLIDYTGDNINKANAALVNFSATNVLPDANCVLHIIFSEGIPRASLILFYNDPTPPAGLFSDFLGITSSSSSLSTRTFLNFIVGTSRDSLNPSHLRGTLSTVSVPDITVPVVNEYYSTPGVFSSAPSVAFSFEPFIGCSIIDTQNAAAFQYDTFGTPLLLFFAWPNATEDAAGFSAIKMATTAITQAVINDGQDLSDTVLYPNYALGDTPLESLYGANVPILKSLRFKYDPTGIFLNTGGFKFV
ncbi:hypothetical protein BS47DRAFT_1358611 [Hydnum rufescens UP504]|uniref:FAD-binding PCMH-type domain-containing protein n=1 Tax=Hydnum rufescens UP504 TaxID=1448309 RepID=A0A9P6E105_9AGAM|nr:hypothetical protein BS47DRAFT_1358611 [Hydnum rufescens UP504]